MRARWWLVCVEEVSPDGPALLSGVFVRARSPLKAKRAARRRLRVVMDRDGDQALTLGGAVSVELMPRPGRGFNRW